MLQAIGLAAIATTSFGVFFNVRGKNLPITGLIGGIGYYLYTILVTNGFESYVGMFAASFVMAILAEFAARWRKAPATIFLAPALVPIVPGGRLFNFVLHLLEGNNDLAVVDGIYTLLESGSIAVGIIVVSSVTKVIVRSLNQRKLLN